jgi:hypothetical protein
VTATIGNSRVTSDLRSAIWDYLQGLHVETWAKSHAWPFRYSRGMPTSGELSALRRLRKDKYLSENPYLLPLVTGILGDTGFWGVKSGVCQMCGHVMDGKHILCCLAYRDLHAMEVERLFKEHLLVLRYCPAMCPPKTHWIELLTRVVLNSTSPGRVLPDTSGEKYWIQMSDARWGGFISWTGYISHEVLVLLICRYADKQGFLCRPSAIKAGKLLKSFGKDFFKCLFELLHSYECRGSTTTVQRRCQGAQGQVQIPHNASCNTRFWWRPGQGIIDIAADILGATCDISANSIDLNWKFKSCKTHRACDVPFGVLRGPASPGTCLFAFASRRQGKPPAIRTINMYLNHARFETTSRLVMFMAVNPTVLAHLRLVPDLTIIADFPRGTVRLVPPAVWRYDRSKRMSKYPFVLCLWQTQGYCEMYEESRKLTERRLLPLGVRRVSRNAVTYMEDFERVWMDIGFCIPFSVPENRAQSIFLLTTEEEECFKRSGIRGKSLKIFLKAMRHGLVDFMLKKWIPCCPEKAQRVRRLHTKKPFAPNNRANKGDDLI